MTDVQVLIRADSSSAIGSGHVMRCLTLAQELGKRGAIVRFICKELAGCLITLVENNGFAVTKISEETDEARFLQETDLRADWIIVDHYGLDREWERQARRVANRIMVIDDTADRSHDCDMLLDHNYHRSPVARYQGKVPASCKLLLGPSYALIRDEFSQVGRMRTKGAGPIERVLIFFGGSDLTNETTKSICALSDPSLAHLEIDVVVGASNPRREEIRRLCADRPRSRFHCQIDYMHRLMAEASAAIGAGGTTTWERLAAGLPALVVSVADNQTSGAEALHEAGVIVHLGWHEQVTIERIRTELHLWVSQPEIPAAIRDLGWRLMGGIVQDSSTAGNVADRLMGVLE